MLRVIDTSYWKRDIINTNVDIDAVYTKATEGNYFVDSSCDPIVQWAIARQKKWGFYHFSTNRITDPITEADFFVDNCAGYIGHGIMILDNESYRWSNGTLANDPYDVAWAKAFLDRVKDRTGGVKALVYMSQSVIEGADWSPVINAGYGLICASYVDDNTVVPNFQMNPQRDPNPRWDGVVNDVMWQFTSTGRLDGYGGNLDCNFFFGDAGTWDAYAAIPNNAPAPQPSVPDPVPAEQPAPQPEPTQPTPDPIPQAPADPTTPANSGDGSENTPTDPGNSDAPSDGSSTGSQGSNGQVPPTVPTTEPSTKGSLLQVVLAYIVQFISELINKIKKG